ncbi:Hpt domain-containing protein [Nostoc sp. LEGE 06077]|uniref:Hpt domain-containing protein n=1 Tax=Nostoc sp. LEGE 06077 TaxID=915325 RepID=UPI001D147E6D|nr:Hpt domain-containing protein [Nostoc sp. LEGE 06077]
MIEDSDLSQLSLLDLFNMEVKTQVVLLNNYLLALETNPEPQSELAALMRAAHCIKGAARIVRIEPAVTLAHVMEDCFSAAQAGTVNLTTDCVDVLLQGVDMLQDIADNPNLQQGNHPQIQSLVDAIANISTAVTIPAIIPQVQIFQPEITPSSPIEELVNPQNRTVRVSTDNLNRLMGLAGETIVANKWLESFTESFLQEV